MNVAVFDCYSGISGDMTLGALLDAGFDFQLLQSEIRKLRLPSIKLTVKKTKRGLFSGVKFDVHVDKHLDHAHRHLLDIQKLIHRSRLHPRIKELSYRMFRNLGRAEARVHGTASRDVFFHEVGAIDSIVDLVGAAIAFHHLKIGKVFVRNLFVGLGEVKTGHHGKVMLPCPGALELLKGFLVHHASLPFEMVTPTGAAILATVAEKTEEIPSLEISSIGYGAGSQDFKGRPNLLRVTLGKVSSRLEKDRVLVLETNLDDMSPLGFEILYQRLFKAGALDVYVTPILMKKMRPAYKLSVLFEHPIKQKISEVVFKETTTFGVRFLELDRFLLNRRTLKVPTRFGSLAVKIGSINGQSHIASPEYEDCKKAALAKRVPFREVYKEAKKQATQIPGFRKGSIESG